MFWSVALAKSSRKNTQTSFPIENFICLKFNLLLYYVSCDVINAMNILPFNLKKIVLILAKFWLEVCIIQKCDNE